MIRERIIEAIAPADAIEVYLLDPACEGGGPSGLWFPLHPYGERKRTAILGVRRLEGEQVARMVALWVATLRDDEGMQAMCHYPIHGLRYFSGESILYETSLCWVCNNYYARGENRYVWLGLPGEQPQGPPTAAYKQLREELESIFPIPSDPDFLRRAETGSSQRRGGYGGSRSRRY
jgi:hypothetical protein